MKMTLCESTFNTVVSFAAAAFIAGALTGCNVAPVLDPIGNKEVNEGQTLQFTVSGSDPDTGQTLTFSASNLPSGATFDPATHASS